MSDVFKPAGYSSVSPYLIVNGAAQTIEFLVKVFGAVEMRRVAAPDGKIMHAEMKIDDSIVMLTDGVEDWPPIQSNVHIYVRDVDRIYRRALGAGAVSVQEPVKRGDENKRGGVKDAGGTTWWISTKVE